MASNPMQRKSRNSFLLGMVVTLLITGAIIALLFFQLKQKSDQLKEIEKSKTKVYTLSKNVKAAQVLTQDMFEEKSIHKDAVPSNAALKKSVIDTWFLQTKEGENICTDEFGGLYLDRSGEGQKSDTIIEIETNKEKPFKDFKDNEVLIGDYFINVNGKTEKVDPLNNNNMIQDEDGWFFVDTQNNDKRVKVYHEKSTDEFYIYKIDTSTMNTGNTKTRIKEFLDIKNVPVLARVDMNANTVITPKLVIQSDEQVTNDTRQQEYNMIVLPVDLMTNDYVDIRIMTPGGQDFIVVAKAQVDIPMNADGSYIPDTMRVNLREDEILAMSSAIVEAYGLEGAKLYVTKYVDPAMQEAALPTYTPNAAVTAQIQANPNIVEIAKEEIASRYSEAAKRARVDYLQQSINSTENYLENISDAAEENIGTSITTRQQYLETLNMKEK